MKRTMFIWFFLIGIVLVAAACIPSSQHAKNGADQVNRFTWYVDGRTFSDASLNEPDIIRDWLRENKQVEIAYVSSGGAPEEQMAQMIAARQLPDVVQLERGQNVEKMVQTGQIIPLSQYMIRHENIKRDLGTSMINMLRSSDGKFYQIPNNANSTEKTNGDNCWLVNQAIYNELGRPPLGTFDDLYAYLKLVKSRYPDVIPLEIGEEFDIDAFVYAGMQEGASPDDLQLFGYPQNGALLSIFESPIYRQTMIYINQLFREGLIDVDALVQTRDQVVEKIQHGRVAVMTGDIRIADETREYLTGLGSDWEVIAPVHRAGLSGDCITLSTYDRMGSDVIVISRNAQNPEEIFSYLDWLYSPEGQIVYEYGPQGGYWDTVTPEGYPVLKPEYFASLDSRLENDTGTAYNKLVNKRWVDDCTKYVFEITPAEKRSWLNQQQYNMTFRTSKDNTEFSGLIPQFNTEEGIIYQNISDLYKQTRIRLFFAGSKEEVVRMIEELSAEADRQGLDKLLHTMTEKWMLNREKLGMQ